MLAWRTQWTCLAVAFAAHVCHGAATVAPSRAELISEFPHVRPGGTLTVGVRIALDEGWHTYWVNPGDSGMAPILSWSADVSAQAGETMHPMPRLFDEGGLFTFGHAGEALLVTELRMPASLPGTTVTVRCEAQWLVCLDVCLPQSATLSIELPVLREGAPDRESDPRLSAVREAQPGPREDVRVDAYVLGERMALRVSSETGESWDRATFFPYRETQVTYDWLEDWHAAVDGSARGGGWLFLTRSAFGSPEGAPERVRGLLKLTKDGGGQTLWLPVDAPLAPAPADAAETIQTHFDSLK